MKKDTLRSILIGTAATAFVTLSVLDLIADQEMPKRGPSDLERVKDRLEHLEARRDLAYTQAKNEMRDGYYLYEDEQYCATSQRLDEIEELLKSDSIDMHAESRLMVEQFVLSNKLDSLHSELSGRYIDNHPEFVHVNNLIRAAIHEHDTCVRDCAKRDSLKKIPKWQRIKHNIANMKNKGR